MKYLEITRTRQNEDGIIGILSINNYPVCVTLERPWKNNEANVSCVPRGVYQCKRITSPTFGETFEIMDVPDGRSHCIFHSGNLMSDTKGCVLLGTRIGFLNGELAILESKKAVDLFLKRLRAENHLALIISQAMIC